jgi:glucose-6-phosphate dehydrogenase assembly protein OpcA
MDSGQDITRIVRSWLGTDEHESADRVLGIVIAQLDTTRQRRSWWPARRTADMPTYAKLAIAAAAVIVVAFIGISVLPRASAPIASKPSAPRRKSSIAC